MISVRSFGRSSLSFAGRRRASFCFAVRVLVLASRRWPSGRLSVRVRPLALFAASPSAAPVVVQWNCDGLVYILVQVWCRGT